MAATFIEVPQEKDSVALSSVGDYIQLLKPRIMCLVVFTAVTGMLVAPGTIHPLIGLVSTVCVALGAGAAGALNMWYDSDIDAIMDRTKSRPVPAGKIRREQALECGMVLATLSVFIMAIAVNYASALLLAGSIFSYAVVYTMLLKRRTPQNIVIGGIAGAFPPVIGWASVSGAPSFESLALFAIIFVWTPPHFWAISLLTLEEYKKASIPMLPVYCVRKTRWHILLYSAILAVVSATPGLFVKNPILYEILATCLSATFIAYATAVFREKGQPSPQACMGLFKYSIYYLFLLFATVIACGY
ncbi:protoheme IX farnesyltransferase [Anaplasma centrale str. Israel]|uniref:Protoheme IX farnesyltransferase n=1 Tax=Anaplasma centrale (strain Israel) TaxID=574556 RepID=D1ATW4_ANACI|nr:heme o synthase [Anaplasma centrale]ACZ48992.1 protoheme IX farnesyltransferase [Anaplasma centrale str. Israel]